MHKDAAIHAEPGALDHLPTRKAMIVLCGPVAAGKTTLASTRWPNAHIDTEREGWPVSWRRASRRTRNGQLVVFDSTAVTKRVRDICREIAAKRRASAHLVILDTPQDVCAARNAERSDPVPDEVVAELRVAFESARSEIATEPWDSVTIL